MKYLAVMLVCTLVPLLGLSQEHSLENLDGSGLSQDQKRSSGGLVLLYTFEEGKGNLVKDRSGVSPHADLEMKGDTEWRDGALLLKGRQSILRSSGKSEKLYRSLRKTNEVTLEAWIESPDPGNAGPARIMTFSKNSSVRNFTLGQDGNSYDFRLRTTKTSGNGIPSISSGGNTVSSGISHIVYSRDRAGSAKVYINESKEVFRTGIRPVSLRLAMNGAVIGHGKESFILLRCTIAAWIRRKS